MSKERLDVLLVQLDLIESREKAKKYIKSGYIFIDGKMVTKPGAKIDKTSNIVVKGDLIPYVSRGGLKLEHALKAFNIVLKDKIAFDIGASTGGFTDCMLQNGVRKVYAIDVGTDQLSEKIKNNPKVISMDKTNVRYLKKDEIKETGDFVSIDVSFISLKLILPAIKEITSPNVEIVALIKPQFEAGKGNIGKKGIVKDKKIHLKVLKDICEFSKDLGLYFLDLTFSPIKGGDGNIEYLAYITKNDKKINTDELINNVIINSHNNL